MGGRYPPKLKLFHYLTALAFLMAGAAGYLFWQTYRSNLRLDDTIAAQVAAHREKFEAKHTPAFAFSLQELRQTRALKELTDPKSAFPTSHRHPYKEISALARYAETCAPGSSERSYTVSPALKKAWTWHEFICGNRRLLPSGFFAEPPMLHPSGASYVRLAEKSGRPEFESLDWLKKHSSALHLVEAIQDKRVGGLGVALTAWELQNLLNGESLVLSSQLAFVASHPSSGFSSVVQYRAYPRSEWERFSAETDLVTSERLDSAECIYRESGLCWRKNPAQNVVGARTLAALLFAGFVALGSVLAVGGYRRIRLRKQEAAQKLFMLQMLTHELRTPATSLRLSLETLRSEFDSLPAESQKAFLRLCEELQRLDRVVEASGDYLRSDEASTRQVGSLQASAASYSANQLVATTLEVYEGRVSFVGLAQDRPLKTNRYWLELCIKNLVENALAHGSPPVKVALTEAPAALIISVEDGGTLALRTLDELSEPFFKGKSSKGLGLGLAIVRKVMRSMGGDLELKTQPTRFLLSLKDQS